MSMTLVCDGTYNGETVWRASGYHNDILVVGYGSSVIGAINDAMQYLRTIL